MTQLPLFEPSHPLPQKQSQKHSISSTTTKRIAYLQLKVELLPPEPAKPTTPVRLCHCGKPTSEPVLYTHFCTDCSLRGRLGSGNPERTLPALTEAIEFLERIQRANPFLQRIALRLYGFVLGIDQRHLYRIASIYLDLAGGAR